MGVARLASWRWARRRLHLRWSRSIATAGSVALGKKTQHEAVGARAAVGEATATGTSPLRCRRPDISSRRAGRRGMHRAPKWRLTKVKRDSPCRRNSWSSSRGSNGRPGGDAEERRRKEAGKALRTQNVKAKATVRAKMRPATWRPRKRTIRLGVAPEKVCGCAGRPGRAALALWHRKIGTTRRLGPVLRDSAPAHSDGPGRLPCRQEAALRGYTDRLERPIPSLYRRVGDCLSNQHRASPHREARHEARTPRRPKMRAHTIATKARVGTRARTQHANLALGLAVVLLAATASTASADRSSPRGTARRYRRRRPLSTRCPWNALIPALGASTSATGRSERRAPRRALRWGSSTPTP